MVSAARRVSCLVVCVVALLLTMDVGHACSCYDLPTISSAFTRSTDVFVGTVVAPIVPNGTSRWQVRVDASWKGVQPGSLVEVTSAGSGTCGVGLRQGQEIAVFSRRAPADSSQLVFHISICTQPRPFPTAVLWDTLGMPVKAKEWRKR